LRRHSVAAELVHARGQAGNVSATLRDEAARRGADLIVMDAAGRYTSPASLTGAVATELMRHAPVPLVVAH
jgi:nucleotide-binding universal stress UspA family protein